MPTILAATGSDGPDNLPGLNLLDAQAVADRDTIFAAEYDHYYPDVDNPTAGLEAQVIIQGQWKLILPVTTTTGKSPPELYNVFDDPREEQNLAGKHPERVRELGRLIDRHLDESAALQPARNRNPADHWVATDALGRTLPEHREVGPRRPEKYVGIFYFVWNGHHASRVYDIPKILATGEPEKHWGPPGVTHFWSEPEQGYFHSSDPWVIRRDMQMLVNAGVDFIFLDVTNRRLFEDSVDALLKVIRQMRTERIPAPGVVFTTNTASGKTINRIYDRFYKSPETKGYGSSGRGGR